jgi:hypothetical protein
MTGTSIVMPIWAVWSHFGASKRSKRADLHTFWMHPERLPSFVCKSPVAMHYLNLLGPLDWTYFPERNLVRNWGQPAVSYAAFLGAYLVKLEEGRGSMGDLRQ